MSVMVIHKAALVGLFPNGQTWARRAPSLKDLGIRPGTRADPLKEIKDQWFHGVRHGYLRF